MSEIVYGVDKDREFSPKDVLSAIENCFLDAHKEVVDEMLVGEGNQNISLEEKDKIRQMDTKSLINLFMQKAGSDYENPTKADILKLMGKLREFSVNFRAPEIVEKHYNEIRGLVDVLKD